MENWIIKMLLDVFSKHFGLQEALKSKDELVSKEAVQILSELTGLRRNYIAGKLEKISKI
ncbi:hypothetical protein [Kaistella antarctica]|nr:hypothetical protein [Kaistella antarctica]